MFLPIKLKQMMYDTTWKLDLVEPDSEKDEPEQADISQQKHLQLVFTEMVS